MFVKPGLENEFLLDIGHGVGYKLHEYFIFVFIRRCGGTETWCI